MGFLDKLKEYFSPNIFSIYPMVPEELNGLMGDISPAHMWRTQPHLRTVVNFLSRNIAQVGLHSYTRVDETDRQRDRTSVVAKLLLQPNLTTTQYELIFAIVGDLALYDRAFLTVSRNSKTISGWELRRIPPSWVSGIGGNAFAYKAYRVQNPSGAGYVEVPAESMIDFHGYSPDSERNGSSPINAIKEILKEQLSAMIFRNQVWMKGGKFSAIITRPKGVRWSEGQRNAFREDWNRRFVGPDATDIGGTPILEDGMTLERLDHSAAEQQYIEGAKLALSTIAAVYHVSPVMVGILDNANYSNVKEFRRMLYGDTLAPLISQIEARLNGFLLPMLEVDPMINYLEFNIQEKLKGNFEEQTQAMQASVGRPWMTVNEARARQNMPALDGDANEIATPMNLLIGGNNVEDVEAGENDQAAIGAGDLEPVTVTSSGLTAQDVAILVGAAATLIRSGFDPEGALVAVGLDPIKHLGLLPITVQKPALPAGGVDEEAVEDLKSRFIMRDDHGQLMLPGPDDQKDEHQWPVYEPAFIQSSKGWKIYGDGRKIKAVRDQVRQTRSALRGETHKLVRTRLDDFFAKQQQVIGSRLGAKDASWWDEGRWDTELKNLLLPLGADVSVKYAREALAEIAVPPDLYDQARTMKYLTVVAEKMAQQINARTKTMITAGIAEGKDWRDTAAFTDGRSDRLTRSTVTGWAAFGVHEAGAQSGAAEKTWVTGHNPRPGHADMDGETVALDDTFSNGQFFPGSGGGENSGCNCSMSLEKG